MASSEQKVHQFDYLSLLKVQKLVLLDRGNDLIIYELGNEALMVG